MPRARGGLRDTRGGDFRVQNGMPGVLQGSLNIIPRQFRVAAQQRIPGFIVGQLFQDGGHGNSCAFDDWLAATHTRIDFNALAHVGKIHGKREPVNILHPSVASSRGRNGPVRRRWSRWGGACCTGLAKRLNMSAAGSWANLPRDEGRKR